MCQRPAMGSCSGSNIENRKLTIGYQATKDIACTTHECKTTAECRDNWNCEFGNYSNKQASRERAKVTEHFYCVTMF